jgi:hypothetical protein
MSRNARILNYHFFPHFIHFYSFLLKDSITKSLPLQFCFEDKILLLVEEHDCCNVFFFSALQVTWKTRLARRTGCRTRTSRTASAARNRSTSWGRCTTAAAAAKASARSARPPVVPCPAEGGTSRFACATSVKKVERGWWRTQWRQISWTFVEDSQWGLHREMILFFWPIITRFWKCFSLWSPKF